MSCCPIWKFGPIEKIARNRLHRCFPDLLNIIILPKSCLLVQFDRSAPYGPLAKESHLHQGADCRHCRQGCLPQDTALNCWLLAVKNWLNSLQLPYLYLHPFPFHSQKANLLMWHLSSCFTNLKVLILISHSRTELWECHWYMINLGFQAPDWSLEGPCFQPWRHQLKILNLTPWVETLLYFQPDSTLMYPPILWDRKSLIYSGLQREELLYCWLYRPYK